SSASPVRRLTISNHSWSAPLDSTFFDYFQKFAEIIRRSVGRAAGTHGLHFEGIGSGNRHFQPGRVFARQPFDDGIRGLTAPRVENLHIMRVRLLAHPRSMAVKNDGDLHSRPVLIMPEFLD